MRLYRDAITPELEPAAKDACKGVGKGRRLTPAQRRWIDAQAAERWEHLPQWERDEYKKAAGVYVHTLYLLVHYLLYVYTYMLTSCIF